MTGCGFCCVAYLAASFVALATVELYSFNGLPAQLFLYGGECCLAIIVRAQDIVAGPYSPVAPSRVLQQAAPPAPRCAWGRSLPLAIGVRGSAACLGSARRAYSRAETYSASYIRRATSPRVCGAIRKLGGRAAKYIASIRSHHFHELLHRDSAEGRPILP